MQTLQSIWLFIQDQLLGMKWLNAVIGDALSALGLDTASRLGGSVRFFLYDVIKITVLLCFLIFMISYIQSYFPPERSKKILGRFHGIWANIISALLGTVTPFCSCSSIPVSYTHLDVYKRQELYPFRFALLIILFRQQILGIELFPLYNSLLAGRF